MAEAVVSGIINKQFIKSKNVWVTNKDNQERLNEMEKKYNVSTSQDKATIVQDADIVDLSTKPYDVENAIKSMSSYLTVDQIAMSAIAAVSTVRITARIGREVPVIRLSRSTSASSGYSPTASTQGEVASQKDVVIANELIQASDTINIIDE